MKNSDNFSALALLLPCRVVNGPFGILPELENPTIFPALALWSVAGCKVALGNLPPLDSGPFRPWPLVSLPGLIGRWQPCPNEKFRTNFRRALGSLAGLLMAAGHPWGPTGWKPLRPKMFRPPVAN